MNKFRLVAIAMLVFAFTFSSVIIAKDKETSKNSKQTCEQMHKKQCDSDMKQACKKSCGSSECTPEKMKECKKQCDMKKMDCSPEKMEQCKKQCNMKNKDCSPEKMKEMCGTKGSKKKGCCSKK